MKGIFFEIESKKINLTGQKIGKWTVGKEIKKNGKTYYECTCECGTKKDVYKWSLLRGDTTSCGCARREQTRERFSKDKVGTKIGKLTLVERLPNYKNNSTYYKCVCQCGNECIVSDSNLSSGQTGSCGCNTKIRLNRRKDYTGNRFGMLIVLEMLYNYGNNKRTHAKCLCECGNITIVDMANLKKGATKSCGCLETYSRYNRNHYEDLSGQNFGLLTAIEMLYISNYGNAIWKCKCTCGNFVNAVANNLKTGRTTSCGCNHYNSNALDLKDIKFGKLTPIYYIRGNGKTKRKWFCRCDCGNTTLVTPSDLVNGNTLSCGCLRKGHMEIYIANIMNENGMEFIEECRFDECKNKRSLPFDFYLPKYNTCIEYDGKQHFEPIDFFGGENAFQLRQYNDDIKTQFCLENNIFLLRLPYTMSKNEIANAILSIKSPVTITA